MITAVKTLTFCVNNAFGNKDCMSRYRSKEIEESRSVDYLKVSTPKEIDDKINEVCKAISLTYTIEDIRFNYVTVSQHNNGKMDTIELYVNILYR